MTFVSVRELKAKASEYLQRASRGERVVVTARGRPRAALVPLDEDGLEDFVLANHPRYVRMIERAAREYARKGGVSLATLLAEAERAPRR